MGYIYKQHSVILQVVTHSLASRLGPRAVPWLGVRLGRANAFRAAAVALGALGPCRAIDSLAVGEEPLGISIETPAVGVASLEVPVEVSLPVNLLWATSLAIRPESSLAGTSIAFAALTLALAASRARGLLGSSVITKGHCKV